MYRCGEMVAHTAFSPNTGWNAGFSLNTANKQTGSIIYYNQGQTTTKKSQLYPWVVVATFYSISTICGLLRTIMCKLSSCSNEGEKQVRSKVYTGALLFLFTVILYLFISRAISMLCMEVVVVFTHYNRTVWVFYSLQQNSDHHHLVFMHAFLTCNVTDVLLHCTVLGVSFLVFTLGQAQ